MKIDVSSARRRSATVAGLDVLEQLRVVIRLAGSHSSRLERATGVPGAQIWALHEVAQAEGLSVGELAQRMRVHQTTVSNLLNRLESNGLLRRGRSVHDQRVVHIHLTPAGRRTLARAPGPAHGLLPSALERMSSAQLRKVYDGLSVLVAGMGGFDTALASKPMPFNE